MSTPCHYILFIYLCTELNAAIYIKGVWDSVVGMAAGRPGDRIPLGARFSAPVQTGPGAHPASFTVVDGFLPGV
jgi:hypothetical protein